VVSEEKTKFLSFFAVVAVVVRSEKRILTATAQKANEDIEQHPADPATVRVLFSFSKQGRGVFLSHLALIEVFSMAFIRAGIPVLYSQGFNPQPRLSFASPLSIGIAADAEIATVDLDLGSQDVFSAENFAKDLNPVLPEGIVVTEALKVVIPSGAKKQAVPALLWGYSYDDALVPAGEEKQYRQNQSRTAYGLRRKSVLAKNPQEPEKPESYFAVYKQFYYKEQSTTGVSVNAGLNIPD